MTEKKFQPSVLFSGLLGLASPGFLDPEQAKKIQIAGVKNHSLIYPMAEIVSQPANFFPALGLSSTWGATLITGDDILSFGSEEHCSSMIRTKSWVKSIYEILKTAQQYPQLAQAINTICPAIRCDEFLNDKKFNKMSPEEKLAHIKRKISFELGSDRPDFFTSDAFGQERFVVAIFVHQLFLAQHEEGSGKADRRKDMYRIPHTCHLDYKYTA